MGLHTTGSRETRPRTTAPCDRFVVLPAPIAKGEVVHGALSRRHGAHGGEQEVAERLGGFHIPRHHSSWRLGIEQTPLRHHQRQGLKTTGIEGDRLLHQTAQYIEHGGLGHRQRSMKVVIALQRAATEIQHRLATVPLHPQSQPQPGPVIQLHLAIPVLQTIDQAANGTGRMVLNMLEIAIHTSPPFSLKQCFEQLHSEVVRRHLSL